MLTYAVRTFRSLTQKILNICNYSVLDLNHKASSSRIFVFLLQKDDRVCAQLFCFDAGSGYCVAYRPAAEGSPCGDGQVCFVMEVFT